MMLRRTALQHGTAGHRELTMGIIILKLLLTPATRTFPLATFFSACLQSYQFESPVSRPRLVKDALNIFMCVCVYFVSPHSA